MKLAVLTGRLMPPWFQSLFVTSTVLILADSHFMNS